MGVFVRLLLFLVACLAWAYVVVVKVGPWLEPESQHLMGMDRPFTVGILFGGIIGGGFLLQRFFNYFDGIVEPDHGERKEDEKDNTLPPTDENSS